MLWKWVFNKDKKVLLLTNDLKRCSKYLQKNKSESELVSRMLDQALELGQSIKALLQKGFLWQALILNRTLGEIVVLIFVVCSLKKKTKDAYLAIYELHGWYEIIDIFTKSNFKKHKKPIFQKKIKLKISRLEKIVMVEFEVKKKELKRFVQKKLSSFIYVDAKLMSEKLYKDFPGIQKSVSKILKGGAVYKAESNFTHGKYVSAIMKMTKIKEYLIMEVIDRIHLALLVFAVHEDKPTLLESKK